MDSGSSAKFVKRSHKELIMSELVLIFDTETTGLPNWKEPSESELQPHIVQLAAGLFNTENKKIIQSIDLIIKPESWDIPKVVSDIHGITKEYAMDVGVSEKVCIEAFLDLWSGRKRIAHNATFDNRIIRIATKRYCEESVINSWATGVYECTGLLSKPIMKMEPKNKYGYKMPKLIEAYKHFTGNDLENAHTAMADMQACADVYFAMKDLKEVAQC